MTCPECKHGNPVPGDGPQPCSYLLVGEAPARWELSRNRPFMGDSGIELNERYLITAGLVRQSVRVTNACLGAFPGFRNPTIEEARLCSSNHMPRELLYTQPDVIVCMGLVAISVFEWFTHGQWTSTLDLETDHGIPVPIRFRSRCGPVRECTGIPTYHPAAGLRSDKAMIALEQDFRTLGELRHGGYHKPEDLYPSPDYREIRTVSELYPILKDGAERLRYSPGPAVDTETDMDSPGCPPWSLQFSFEPGTGYLIRSGNRPCLDEWLRYLCQYRPLLILHNALGADLDALHRLTGHYPPRWTDSMMLAYHQQDVPQGLKPLAYRLCGMEMRSYDDVVTPYSLAEFRSWLDAYLSLMDLENQSPYTLRSGPRKGQTELRWTGPKQSKPTYNKAMKLRLDLDSQSGCDPWDRWNGWKPEDRDQISATMSLYGYSPEPPLRSIRHVPEREAIRYACRDADAALRVFEALTVRSRILWFVG